MSDLRGASNTPILSFLSTSVKIFFFQYGLQQQFYHLQQMQIVSDYFQSKSRARQWMLSEIEAILRQIELSASESTAREHFKLAESLQGLDRQQISSRFSQLANKQSLYLLSILEKFIASLHSLSQALIHNSAKQATNPSPLVVPQQIPKITFQHTLVAPVQTRSIQPSISHPPVEINISQKGPATATSHSLMANQKPFHQNLHQKSPPETLSNTEQKMRESSPFPCVIEEASNTQEEVGENHDALRVLYEEGVRGREICAESCLQLDNKIYVEASDYLEQVKNKNRGGQHSRSFLSQSPQAQSSSSENRT